MDKKQFLEGIIVYILQQGLSKTRRGILAKQVETHGGGVANKISQQNITHLVVGDSVKPSRLLHLLKVDSIPESIQVVYADWLSDSFVAGQQLETFSYLLKSDTQIGPIKRQCDQETIEIPLKKSKEDNDQSDKGESPDNSSSIVLKSDIKTTPTKRPIIWAAQPDSDSDYVESDDETSLDHTRMTLPKKEDLEDEGLIKPLPKKGKWLCQIPSTQLKQQENHNEALLDKLQELLATYKSSSMPKDQWRAMSLNKAMAVIKKHPKEITSYEEARNIPFVGDRLADKIHEIITSGHLRRLDMIDKEKEAIIELFTGIHGVGRTTAEEYHAKGYRCLDDVKRAGVLNRIQLIGLKHYEEFKERMCREEVEEIEEKIKKACHVINKGLVVVTCGSYRRGRSTCGDVDILVTHPDGRSHKGVFGQLLCILKDEGFLTDDLTVHDDKGDGSGSKYLGVCRLDGPDRKHRRIDIYTCPYSEYPLMLLHFTGSGHFNRSMRNKADKMGMSLSEHSLNAGVIRKNGVKVFEGTPLPVFSEKDVFNYLDIPYLEPHDRDLP